MNGFSHALAYHLCNKCICQVESVVCLDIVGSLWKHKSICWYINTNLKILVYSFKKLLQTVKQKKYVSHELMRLPKDTNCVCTQHVMLVKGEQIEHGRKRLQLPCGAMSQRTSSRGRHIVPMSKPVRAELITIEPQFGKGLKQEREWALKPSLIPGYIFRPPQDSRTYLHIQMGRDWDVSYLYSHMNKSPPVLATADKVLVPEASWVAMESSPVQVNEGWTQALALRGISGQPVCTDNVLCLVPLHSSLFALVQWRDSSSTGSRAGEKGQIGQVEKGELWRNRKEVLNEEKTQNSGKSSSKHSLWFGSFEKCQPVLVRKHMLWLLWGSPRKSKYFPLLL